MAVKVSKSRKKNQVNKINREANKRRIMTAEINPEESWGSLMKSIAHHVISPSLPVKQTNIEHLASKAQNR